MGNQPEEPADLHSKLRRVGDLVRELWHPDLRKPVGIAMAVLSLLLVVSLGMRIGLADLAPYFCSVAVVGLTLIVLQTFYLYAARALVDVIEVKSHYLLALLATTVGAAFYAARIGMDTPPNSPLFSGPYVAERYGRHVFLALPVLQGTILVIGGIAVLLSEDKRNRLPATVRNAIQLAIVVFAVHVALIIAASANVMQWKLATDGPDQGDMNPIYSMVLPISILGIGSMIMHLRPATATRWLHDLFLHLASVVTLSVACASYLGFVRYFERGTGIGVVTTTVAAVIQILASTAAVMSHKGRPTTP